ncbi:MAG: hypothetical protein GY708_22425 [Actinomycetia bacterium]|nr:hypothetical protein [Actinomycetes bacterium]
MGGSYEHLLALETSAAETAELLAGQDGWIAGDGATVAVFVRSESLADPSILTSSVSTLLNTPVLRFSVFDDDVLTCELWREGELVADVSVPDMFEYADTPEELAMLGIDVATSETSGPEPFVNVLARGERAQALALLTDPADALGTTRVYATDLHRELLKALDLPTFAVGWDFFGLEAVGDQYEGPELTALS